MNTVFFRRALLCAVFMLCFFSLTACADCLFRPVTETTSVSDVSSIGIGTDTSTDTATSKITDAFITTPEETTTPPEPQILTTSFLGAGDNIIYYGNVRDAKSLANERGRAYNFAPIYDLVKERIAVADIAFINQETLMCGEGYDFSYYPYFNSPQDLGYDLAEVGFDVINIANNHMLDKGADGLSATIDFYHTLDGITMIGGYKDQTDYENIRVIESGGIRIAFLSYAFFTNYLTLPAGSPLVVPYPDEEKVPAEVSRAKEIADFVIVSVHWGCENSFTPDEEQRSFAELLASCGVDAIIGHHPHVIQPIEWIDRADGGRTLCVYSLGNFVAEMPRDYNMLGGMIAFDMILTDGVPTIENVEFIPTVYYYTISFYKNSVHYLSDFTEELAASHGLPYYGRTLQLSALKKYLTDTISDEFLKEYLSQTTFEDASN